MRLSTYVGMQPAFWDMPRYISNRIRCRKLPASPLASRPACVAFPSFFTSETGHAGTVPIAGCKNAMVALSRMIAAITDKAERETGLLATFGQIAMRPNVVDTTLTRATAMLEIRSLGDGQRNDFGETCGRLVTGIAARSGCSVAMHETLTQAATTCDTKLQRLLANRAATAGDHAQHFTSNATHNASAMADLCPTAMLFVRSQRSISHRPDEFTISDDTSVATGVMTNFIRLCGT